VKIFDHYNIKELIIESIEQFNTKLKAFSISAEYLLDDNVDRLDTNYAVYLAKKKGGPKDDYPS